MPNNIDYDRGVIKRTHSSGAEIFMYKDDPGVFLNAFGTEVDEAMAREAGMNVDKYGLARKKKARMTEAMQLIDAEFSSDVNTVREVIQKRGGFTLVAIGHGRHILEDPDGNNLTPNPLTLEEGELLFDKMAPKAAEDPDPPATDEPKVLTASDVIAMAGV